ncbi:Saposin A-type domain-containing protein [Meloidogyne graminicola]|uniref:Saposin A-type domain-containing protein n=1 Tax=Meloidogyne graminicola TaxID=189291 RepID=A0A8S9ZKQ0_9BILA|nr:Saposin A-type domain-containing protein [Meloidogyne graminicola]
MNKIIFLNNIFTLILPSQFLFLFILRTVAYSDPYTIQRVYSNSQHSQQQQRNYFQQQQQQCNLPPDFWCDSYEIAQRCNVVQQCEAFKSSTSIKPLRITLMFEALCPYCQRYIANNLGSLQSRFGNNTILELVPWGNSILLRNGKISCNHGPKECDANRLLSCVINEVSISQTIQFTICFEHLLSSNLPVEQAIQTCSGYIRERYKQIKQCYISERGQQLQKQAAQRTMSSKPNPIIEVPYLIINDYTPNLDGNAINNICLPHLIQKWVNLKNIY